MRPRKPPRLYLRKTGYVILDGGREIACHTRDLGEAEKALVKYLSGSIRDVVAEYLKRPTATDFNQHISKPILEWWGDMTPFDVSESTCRRYFEHRSQSVKASTVRHELIFLKSSLNWWRGWPENRPEFRAWLPPRPDPRTGYFLTRNQVARRLWVARHTHRHICRLILICVYSGTRPGAALDLRWLPAPTSGWIDLQAGLLHRGPEISRNKRKGTCRIHLRLLTHLKRWQRIDAQNGHTHCIHLNGKSIKRVHKAWRWVMRAAGQGPDGPHICRHTCATWMMQSGVSYYEASGYLGLSPETLERHYEHHRPDFQQAAAQARGR
jgi:integrase